MIVFKITEPKVRNRYYLKIWTDGVSLMGPSLTPLALSNIALDKAAELYFTLMDLLQSNTGTWETYTKAIQHFLGKHYTVEPFKPPKL